MVNPSTSFARSLTSLLFAPSSSVASSLAPEKRSLTIALGDSHKKPESHNVTFELFVGHLLLTTYS